MKLKTNELRIGNYVNYHNDDIIFQVTDIDEKGIGVKNSDEETWIEIDQFSAIPITKEWLERFGFEFLDNALSQSFVLELDVTNAFHESISISPNTDKNGMWYCSFRQGDFTKKYQMHKNDLVILSNSLQFVHQLQNLYFSLIGEELEIIK